MSLNKKMDLHDTPMSKLADIKASDPLNSDNKYAANDICTMIEFLMYNIYVLGLMDSFSHK